MSPSLEDSRIMVTGATGFIGSWLTEHLVGSGADVSVLINREDPIGTDSILHLMKNVKPFYGDITKPAMISNALKDQETVFHLAALTQVIHSFTMPKEFFDVNAVGTLNILENLRKSESLELLIFSSTDKVYGEPDYVPIDEKHRLSAKSPYDASKLAAEALVESYNRTYGLPATRTRWSNTIGGRDANILRAVPDFATSIMRGKPPTIRGDGTQVRDYMYVTDAVSGIVAAAQNKKTSNGKAFNLGTEKPTTVLQIADLVIESMGMGGKMKPIVLGENNPGEIDRQYLSAKAAREELKWSPKVSLEDAVKASVEWYRKNPAWYDLMIRVKDYWDSKRPA